ncbi:unnamed protein product [Nesidiocoris tenuis]|uniref:Uncharacterized protein n=1 Tax=Nesidiocoris tenuis TaxID=355587 RepID=A0A6H5FXN1_9HEMI|nr:unnamed protein product [Nesidiocoris tenuis]CAA9994063.1 unnamed protein product [Nesidiocoris tenuis]
MTSQIARILLLAALAFAVPGQAGSLESGATGAGYNSNGEASLSSGAYPASSGYGSGASALPVGSGYGGGTASSGAYPYNGAVTSDGAFAASSAGSYSGASGSNAAPSLSGGRFPSNSPTPNSGGGSYAGGYQGNPTAGPGAYGPQKTQGFPFNLPQGCFSGFPSFGSDPYQIHQQILNQIQRLQEENLRLSSQFAGASPQ